MKIVNKVTLIYNPISLVVFTSLNMEKSKVCEILQKFLSFFDQVVHLLLYFSSIILETGSRNLVRQ